MPSHPSFLLLSLLLLSCAPLPGEPAAEAEATTPRSPIYDRIELPQATVHVVHIPDPAAYPVRVAVTDDLMRLGEMVADTCGHTDCAVAAINAGFFDPNNGLTTSYGIVDGGLVADPSENQRLVGNPTLAPYMDQILNRSEFRRYDCDEGPQYAIAPHQAPVPSGCTLVDAIGAGPQLLPEDTSIVEAFVDPSASPPRDALGSQSANARSAVGLTAEGGLILVMVAQVPGAAPSGFTFADLATFMAERGVVQALNLDGGSSSTLMFKGEIHYGRLDPAGEPIQRPIKSILWVDTQAP
ncbi:MAG: phosphodiester glycosidase family protein [Leptolyngbya sp. LCM1.Bin17]|nr:MAG: phosphodiester glycosidase family protein [Leptolyngbya sp. LCM1.Bin17]